MSQMPTSDSSHGKRSSAACERLFDAFNQYFEVIYADTDALREAVFRIRYQVYCVETQFEDPENHPDGLEQDAFDCDSRHVLLRHRTTGWDAGTVRLAVLRSENDPFPVEEACGDVFSVDRLGDYVYQRSVTAEVSRFAVSKEFRRRYQEYLSPAGIGPDEPMHGSQPKDRRTRDRETNVVPHIQLGLIRGLVAISRKQGIQFWCAAMEPALLRRLARIGIHFHDSGSLVEYHGKRQPCIARVKDLLGRVAMERPDIWEVLALEP